jgi:hypothetical protein
MNGGRIIRRVLARGLGALALIGAVAWMGTAHASDRTSDVVCVDSSTGDWRATMRFTSIDVHDGHPVTVTFGSATSTLTSPGADGAVTLRQDFSGADASAHRSWSIVRNGVVERAGSETFHRPDGCAAPDTTVPPTSEPPGTGPPTTVPPTTVPPTTGPPTTGPPTTGPAGPIPTSPPPATTVPKSWPLPVTGRGATGLIVVVGVAVAIAGALAVRGARRRPDQLIGD